ncbi:MAG TPA: VTT domain-containing protein [Candidatus Nanoarchaeia archaeon]|nr:VTT domain-containing protein [Candidatus Nanoarchaeia archaeon]
MRKKFIFIVPLVLLIIFLFWSSVTLQGLFSDVVGVVEGYIIERPLLGVSFFLVLAAVSAFLSPFSSFPLIPFAIPIWGEVITIILLTIGWLLGGLIAYAVGRYAGYPILLRLIPLDKIEKAQEHIPEDLAFKVVVLFRLAMPSEITSYILGILRYKFWHYFWATLISELIFAILAVYVSSAVIGQKPLLFVSWLLAIIIVFVGTFYLIRRNSEK